MGILIDDNTHVLVQGITGFQGTLHTKIMLSYGTKIVAGVRQGKGGSQVHGVQVYNSVKEAQKEHAVNASIIFVPAQFAAEAALESINAGIELIVIVTENIPLGDTINIIEKAKKSIIIGPNSPGIINPKQCKLGIMPNNVFKTGNVGLISRSGTLTYEIVANLTNNNIGQSTCVGIGGDPITGISFNDCLKLFKEDHKTEALVLIGEIGGNIEEITADFISRENFPKPIVAYVAGSAAPPEKRMGHAGAIILGESGTTKSKIEAFIKSGVKIAEKPNDIVKLLKKMLKK